MSNIAKVLKTIKDKEIKFVDLRFTDTKGKWQHTAQTSSTIDEKTFKDGIMCDGSSIAGWKNINESEMILMPDPATAVLDPFTAQPSLILFCDVIEPADGKPYELDPRSTGKKAEAYLKSSGIGEKCFFGPEAEFFIFDDVKWATDQEYTFFSIDSEEGAYNTGTEMEGGNMGHRPKDKGGYFPVPPVDSATDIRAEMVSTMTEMGIEMEKHHHEVAPSQHELGFKFGSLIESADNLQKYKYCVHMVAQAYGKTATFMPKPVYNDNGSGMHVHQSIWSKSSYIGGIIKHAKAINAFSNATTNSYKRLVPGFEAPVILAYSARNRSASCRIPYANSANGKRVEVRFGDASGNPYFTFAAMLMAGIDGIKNKIHPGEAMDKDLYDLPESKLKGIPTVSASLRESLDSLDKDREFLKTGGVFTDNLIDAYISLKMDEVLQFEHTPHPVEFKMYYSV